MRLCIRPACAADACAITDLVNPLIEAGIYTVLDRPISSEHQAAFMREFPARGVFHVALAAAGGELLGLQDAMPISAEAAFAHVGAISTFVALGAQGRGARPPFASPRREASGRSTPPSAPKIHARSPSIDVRGSGGSGSRANMR
jgi:hypothetical protein